jgi:hypothetical protein
MLALSFAFASVSALAEPGLGQRDILISGFPDNADLRSKLFSRLLGAPRDIVLKYEEGITQSASGPVLIRVVNRTDDFLIEFRNGPDGFYEQTRRGTCVVQRSGAKGNYLLQARIFLRDNPSCYLRLYPQGSTTRGDVVLYGALVKKGLAIDGMLHQALVRPLTSIVESTRRSFDWTIVFPPTGDDSAAIGEASPGAGPRVNGLAPTEALVSRLEKAASVEDFLAAHVASGEAGAVELGDPVVFPVGISAERSEMGSASSFSPFPHYAAGKGIPPKALRASLYLDAISSPGAQYALIGDDLRAIAVLDLDDSGSPVMKLFVGGREASWDVVLARKTDASIRAIRLSSAQR